MLTNIDMSNNSPINRLIHTYIRYGIHTHCTCAYVEIKCVYWGKGPLVGNVHTYVRILNICTTLCVYEYMSIHAVCMELSFSPLTHGSLIIL